MSGSAKQWLIVLAFFVGFLFLTLVETAWLHRKAAISLGRSLAVAFLPNFFTITVGFAFSALLFMLIIMFVWDRTLQTTESETTVWVATALALGAPLAIFFFAKRIALMTARVEAIRSPWLYSLFMSVVFFLAALVPPFAVTYLF